MNRRQLREQAFSILFQVLEGACGVGEALLAWRLEHDLEEDDPAVVFVADLLRGAVAHQEESDRLIRDNLVNWEFDRLLSVDKHLLRLSLYEMLHGDAPLKVAINEAVLMAKKFGDEGSGAFVNGLLGRVAREREQQEASP